MFTVSYGNDFADYEQYFDTLEDAITFACSLEGEYAYCDIYDSKGGEIIL